MIDSRWKPISMPKRPPDLFIEEDGGSIQWWWEEKLQSNCGTYFRLNPENWTFQSRDGSYGSSWLEYQSTSWWSKYEREIKDSYAKWVMEKELGL